MPAGRHVPSKFGTALYEKRLICFTTLSSDA